VGETPASTAARSGLFFCGFAKSCIDVYLGCMLKAFDFYLPTRSTVVPHGPDWLHEVKYDGYRLRLKRDGTACG